MKKTGFLLLLSFLTFLACNPNKEKQSADNEEVRVLEAQIEEEENNIKVLDQQEAEIDSLTREIEALTSEL